jgi:hypothetical protein
MFLMLLSSSYNNKIYKPLKKHDTMKTQEYHKTIRELHGFMRKHIQAGDVNKTRIALSLINDALGAHYEDCFSEWADATWNMKGLYLTDEEKRCLESRERSLKIAELDINFFRQQYQAHIDNALSINLPLVK